MDPARQPASSQSVLILGIGAFTQAMLRILQEDRARVTGYLTRDYGHYGPRREALCISSLECPNPCSFLRKDPPDLILPMSIEWALKPWTAEFLSLDLPLLSPTGEGLRLERERDFARELCRQHGIPFPTSAFFRTRAEAAAFVREERRPFVIKNPLCAPTSPIHTVVCEDPEETLVWLQRLDDTEGVFLQEYLGRREIGHIALVSRGEVYPLVTNQEYKRAFDGNMGIVAGAPLGGMVERDETDRYGLARDLLQPLLPWFRSVDFHGPVQVTAIRHRERWHVLEYNVRLGVTSGPLIARMLRSPSEVFRGCARNQPLSVEWRPDARFGCSITLAGYGYPFIQLTGPRVPVTVEDTLTCDVWWQEVEEGAPGKLEATGHRLCDVAAVASSLPEALAVAYENIRRIRSLNSYYRMDIGASLWPPGEA
jgi:phosphoribosylamine-glycine ligase